MARELFMDIRGEIMSTEDCIKCYDNGDNTQDSAPGSRGNIRACSRALGHNCTKQAMQIIAPC